MKGNEWPLPVLKFPTRDNTTSTSFGQLRFSGPRVSGVFGDHGPAKLVLCAYNCCLLIERSTTSRDALPRELIDYREDAISPSIGQLVAADFDRFIETCDMVTLEHRPCLKTSQQAFHGGI